MILKDFSLKFTIESGQPLAFYSDYSKRAGEERVRYVTEKGVIDVHARKRSSDSAGINHTFVGGYTKASADKEIRKRLGLSEDMAKVYKRIDSDSFMHSAISELRGLRLTENPPWETTLSFIVSQFNNIKRIRLIMKRMIDMFGEEIEHDGDRIKLFPTPDAIATASIKELMACNAGFRAKYIKSVAGEWETFDYKNIYKLDYSEARENLMELDGVGEKVADCILLMGYGKMEAFPVDVWIQRIVEREYLKRKSKPKEIREFAAKTWGGYAGYAQQYLFWYGRMGGR